MQQQQQEKRLKSATGITTEYVEAVSLLNESTMNSACELVLQEGDGVGDASSSADKLLEMYHKCDAAFQVIQKQQPAALVAAAMTSTVATPGNKRNLGRHGALMPGAPSLARVASSTHARGKMPSKRSSSSLKTTKLSSSSSGSKVGMMRTKPNTPGMHRRGDSHADLSSDALHHEHKKLKPTVPVAPPRAAADFLAKLNGEKAVTTDKSTTKRPSRTTTTSPTNAGKRRNPDRSRRGSTSS